MERSSINPPLKRWKNIIFMDDPLVKHLRGGTDYIELDAREAVAALTRALAAALQEANQLPPKRTRLRRSSDHESS